MQYLRKFNTTRRTSNYEILCFYKRKPDDKLCYDRNRIKLICQVLSQF